VGSQLELDVDASPLEPQLDDRVLGCRDRHAATLHGFVARPDGSTAAVKLTDLSYDGCGIETATEFHAGERVHLAVTGRGAMAAEVRWCSHGRAGLMFVAEPAVRKQISRSGKRIAITAEVTMRRSGRPNYRTTVLDVSTYGCSLEVVDRPEIDEHVWIKFDALEAVEAKVCWIVGHKCGLRYVRPIHRAVFDLMIARLRAAVQS
jgi:hypothetical protein